MHGHSGLVIPGTQSRVSGYQIRDLTFRRLNSSQNENGDGFISPRVFQNTVIEPRPRVIRTSPLLNAGRNILGTGSSFRSSQTISPQEVVAIDSFSPPDGDLSGLQRIQSFSRQVNDGDLLRRKALNKMAVEVEKMRIPNPEIESLKLAFKKLKELNIYFEPFESNGCLGAVLIFSDLSNEDPAIGIRSKGALIELEGSRAQHSKSIYENHEIPMFFTISKPLACRYAERHSVIDIINAKDGCQFLNQTPDNLENLLDKETLKESPYEELSYLVEQTVKVFCESKLVK